MAGPGTANLPNVNIQTKVVGGVTYYSADGGTTWVNSNGEKLSGGSSGHTISQPGSKHFGAAPNTLQTNYQIIDLWGFSDQGEGLVDQAGNNIYKFTGDWAQSRYGVAAPLINQGPNKNTTFDSNSADTRFIYYDPNTHKWNRLNAEQIAQLPENILNQNSSRYSGESASPSVNLFYNPETSLFDAEPQTIRAYYGQPEYTAEDVTYRPDPGSIYDTYNPYGAYETTDPYTNVAELHSARYPYIPPEGGTPSIVRPDEPELIVDPPLRPNGGDDGGGGDGGGPPPPASEFATERNLNLDYLLDLAQDKVLGQSKPERLEFLRTTNMPKTAMTEEQWNALQAYQAAIQPEYNPGSDNIGVSGMGNTLVTPSTNINTGSAALAGYQSSFDQNSPGLHDEQQLGNMRFLLNKAAAGTLNEEQAAFLNSFDRRRYDAAFDTGVEGGPTLLQKRDELKAQGLFAEGGGVASLYNDVDSQVTGQGIESFLQRRAGTVNKMLAQQAMNVPRGTMPVYMNQGGGTIAPRVEIDTPASLSPEEMRQQRGVEKLFASDGPFNMFKKMREQMAADQGITVEELGAMYGYSLPQSDGFLGMNRKLREKQNAMISASPITYSQPNFVASLNQGGDVTVTERTVRDPRDNQYVMEERVVRKQMAFDPDMQTGVMSTLYG